ncbi:hypothetical protein SAMN05216223_12218 [Actinacidiphila yanglinensis]|uniref:Uncharacterized protein n=1 Tax=Actinacidiphila yanglinensis TaxID=310779 RepID=A0A1H6DZ07_9ACTN|nr:hypothetical protein [Actinacidiphila yanglinensis]SEG90577.1 hypothetical protein SAMN05216223_12218 [Actinacidiphila yanglinensis]
MAGVSVTVCLPAEAAGDVEGALAAALAPFDSNGDHPVDGGRWDWWRIAGGSNGYGFAVAEGHFDDPRLIRDMPRSGDIPLPNVPGVCAGGPRGLLDFTRPQAAMERALAASWDLWQELSAIHPAAVPLADFVQRSETDPQAFPDDPYGTAMFAAYREQPLIMAYLEHPFSLGGGRLSFPNPREHPVIAYQGSREEYSSVRVSAKYDAWLRRDVLTTDGWWVEPNGLAVHGACDSDQCVHTAPAVGADTELFLASLPGDTLLVRLHCHY